MNFKRNKKGAIGIILFFVALFMILIIGFIAAIAVGIIDFTGDELTPIFEDLGVVDNAANFSEIATYTVTPINMFVQALPWLVGFAYVVMLIMSVIFAMSFRTNPNPFFIAFYVVMIILLIFGSIIMSNMYEEIYQGDDEIGIRLQEQTILSHMILYSPAILAVIAFITGIYIFAGKQEGGVEI